MYQTIAKAQGGGRKGRAELLDGGLYLSMDVPTEMGGDGNGSNPEQLFALGYAACYLGAMRFVAGAEKLGTVPADASVTAEVGIGPRAEGGFGISATLRVRLPGMDADSARRIAERGHFICPYSNAIKGNVNVVTILE
ncbi:MAG: organic hydroperoxide resistance protein [Gemmobacter sp.]|uniref:organic hydroperoxide resistance protein n=1 Tax=Gemmobacter sp. TaxID=1898957 RepID=UPI001A378AFF|nr:organic hydroperoxide resistance protein [Gemmobacter sp.]MBL8562606.1 organic hydroperoxide resistance protein [Gemmobacter sp.]